MNNQKKSIDGLVTRSDRMMSADVLHKNPTKKPAKKSVKKIAVPTQARKIDAEAVEKMAKNNVKKRKAAADDFLKPVEAFDFDFTEDDIKKSSKHNKKPRKKWSKKRKVLTIIASVLAALLLVF